MRYALCTFPARYELAQAAFSFVVKGVTTSRMLFDKIRKNRQPENPEVDQVFDRLQSMREQVAGHRQSVPVADLFGLPGREESRPRWPLVPEASRPHEPERVRPEDVPSNQKYVSWE